MSLLDLREQGLNDLVVELGRLPGGRRMPGLAVTPLLEALRRVGTSHFYADTADREELGGLLEAGEDRVLAEIDGNTANQPLVEKVADRYLRSEEAGRWVERIRGMHPAIATDTLTPLLYTVICGRIGNELAQAFAAGRSWETSLQLHMSLGDDLEASKQVGRDLRRMVPSAFVKVPFTPHQPHCFLIARDLEREGIPVNFTSTFSARQAVAAALLADVTRTNIFMGRLNGGLKAELLGEQVDLEAQRALLRLRREKGVKTRLIVASIHDWRSIVRTAGCDVYTAPVPVIREFLAQDEVPPEGIGGRLETSYEDRLGIDPQVLKLLPGERIARLWRVEPELIEFLAEYRESGEYRDMEDGDALHRRFDRAGFADLFYDPSPQEWSQIRRSKLPDLRSAPARSVALDTLYSLLADADFENIQAQIDRRIEARIEGRAA